MTLARPAFELNHEGNRVQLNVDYELEALFYSKVSQRNETYHDVVAEVTTAIIQDLFFLDLNGEFGQQAIDPKLPLSSTNLPVTSNRTDGGSYTISPYIRRAIGGMVVDARYRQDKFEYDDPILQDLESFGGEFSLSGGAENRFNWALNYQYDRYEYELSPELEAAEGSHRIGYSPAQALELFVSGGLESDYRNRRLADLDEEIWEAGVAWNDGPNSLEIAVGDRSFGSTVRFDYVRSLPSASFNVSYEESPGTAEDFRLGGIRTDETVPVSDLDRPGQGRPLGSTTRRNRSDAESRAQ